MHTERPHSRQKGKEGFIYDATSHFNPYVLIGRVSTPGSTFHKASLCADLQKKFAVDHKCAP